MDRPDHLLLMDQLISPKGNDDPEPRIIRDRKSTESISGKNLMEAKNEYASPPELFIRLFVCLFGPPSSSYCFRTTGWKTRPSLHSGNIAIDNRSESNDCFTAITVSHSSLSVSSVSRLIDSCTTRANNGIIIKSSVQDVARAMRATSINSQSIFLFCLFVCLFVCLSICLLACLFVC